MKGESAKLTPHKSSDPYWKEPDIIAPIRDPMVRFLASLLELCPCAFFEEARSVNPYEHLFWNFAFFYRKPWAWKVGAGGVFPDLIYMIPFMPRVFSYGSFLEWMHDPLRDAIWNSPIAVRDVARMRLRCGP